MSRAAGMRVGVTACVVPLVLTLASCAATDGGSHRIGSAPYVQGSGTLATETRSLAEFHALSAAQGIEVFVSSGDSAAATVTADDNLLAHVTTEVTDGRLSVAIKGSIETRNPLKVEVTAATPIDALAADLGASVDCEDLQPASLEVRASSGSTIRGGGRAGTLTVTADSGSTIDLRNVETQQAQVDARVGSTVHVHATDVVRGSCTLGSTLRLYGTPATLDVATDAGSTVSD